jgi:hypothetical protein
MHSSLSDVDWFQHNRALSETALSEFMHKGKHSETRTSSVIFYFLRRGQEHYGETVLSEAHYSEGYLQYH